MVILFCCKYFEIFHTNTKHYIFVKKAKISTLFLTERVTAVCGKQTEIGTVVFRTAIEVVSDCEAIASFKPIIRLNMWIRMGR